MSISALPFCHITLHGHKTVSDRFLIEPKTFGDHLKKRRLELELTQREVAEQLSVNKATITFWEKGHSFPQSQYIPRIINFIGYQPFADILDRPVGEKFILLRQLLGITQDELADRLHVGRSTLSRWEHGEHNPQPRAVKTVERLLAKLVIY